MKFHEIQDIKINDVLTAVWKHFSGISIETDGSNISINLNGSNPLLWLKKTITIKNIPTIINEWILQTKIKNQKHMEYTKILHTIITVIFYTGFPQNLLNKMLWLFHDQSINFHDLSDAGFTALSAQYAKTQWIWCLTY